MARGGRRPVIPPWAHAVENIDGIWRCQAIIQLGAAHGEAERCTFVSGDERVATRHAVRSQYDARHLAPVDLGV